MWRKCAAERALRAVRFFLDDPRARARPLSNASAGTCDYASRVARLSDLSTVDRPSFFSIYFNRRSASLLALGFASGLPLSMSQDLPKGWLSAVNADVTTIGLFSLASLPYTFKFVWAPVVDWIVPPVLGPRLGRRRAWLVLTQLLLTLALVGLALLGPATGASPLLPFALMAVIVAFFSATQDIVADAYRTDVLSPAERGAGAAVFVMGYRLAMIAANAGTLEAADHFGWRTAFLLVAALMFLCLSASFFSPRPASDTAQARTIGDVVIEPVVQFFTSRGAAAALIVLAFVFLFKIPEDLAKSMEMPLLLKELKYHEADVGRARGFVGLIAVILGAIAGGAIVAKLRLIPALWLFGILHAVSNFAYWLLIKHPGETVPLFAVIALENFCRGLAQAGFIAFLMAQCDPRYSAFQYALLTSLMALSTTASGAASGFIVKGVGYTQFYAWSVLAGVPSLLLMFWLPRPPEERKPGDPDAKPCAACGYDLRGTPDLRCPECGHVNA